MELQRAGCDGELLSVERDEELLRAGCEGKPVRAGCDIDTEGWALWRARESSV